MEYGITFALGLAGLFVYDVFAEWWPLDVERRWRFVVILATTLPLAFLIFGGVYDALLFGLAAAGVATLLDVVETFIIVAADARKTAILQASRGRRIP